MNPPSIYHKNTGEFGTCIRLNLNAVNELLDRTPRITKHSELKPWHRELLQRRYTAYLQAGGRTNFDTGETRDEFGKRVQLPPPLDQLPTKNAIKIARVVE